MYLYKQIKGVLFTMKTKIYRTITLVLAIVMLLGVTPAFAAEDDSEWTVLLTAEDYDNHNYVSIPYDYNIAINDGAYIPFSAMWEYGNRTSASSKLTDGTCELRNGVAYVDYDYSKVRACVEKGMSVKQTAKKNMLPSYLEGNTYLTTAVCTTELCPNLFYNAPSLKLAIGMQTLYWDDWVHTRRVNGYITPTFPRNITVITGLDHGEMAIYNSTNKSSGKIFKNRNEFIEAVKPILAAANLPDETWDMIPKEFGGKTESNILTYRTVSDWAKAEVTKAQQVGIITAIDASFKKRDERNPAARGDTMTTVINTYEAICKANNVPTGYPSQITEVFGPNRIYLAHNKGAYLGIFKGDGTTRVIEKKTYASPGSMFVTREQMAAMLTRLAKACGKTLPSKPMPFTDAMSDWAVPEVSACYGAGLIKGTSATTFGALDNITSEQAIVLCYRAYEYLTNNA